MGGPDEKKKTTQKNNNRKKKLEQLSKVKVLEAQFGLCLFRPNPNLFNRTIIIILSQKLL